MATAALELLIFSLEASRPHRKGFKFLFCYNFFFVGWVLVRMVRMVVGVRMDIINFVFLALN